MKRGLPFAIVKFGFIGPFSLSLPKAGHFCHAKCDPLSLVGCLKGAVLGEPASQNGQLNKNDLSLKSFGHFSRPAAIDTVSAVVNRITFFLVFSKRGDATLFHLISLL